jgi:hypothetical protein
MIKNKQIIGWMFIVNEQLSKLNLGAIEEHRIVHVNIVLLE